MIPEESDKDLPVTVQGDSDKQAKELCIIGGEELCVIGGESTGNRFSTQQYKEN